MGASQIERDHFTKEGATRRDYLRRDDMRLKKAALCYGGTRVNGFKEEKPICKVCDLLKVWCVCASSQRSAG